MELFIRVDPAHLSRLRGQAIIKSCRIGRTRSRREQGNVAAGESCPSFDYELLGSDCEIGGGSWRARMSIEQVTLNPAQSPQTYCRVGFVLLEGSGAPLAAVLQALAEKLPVQLVPSPRWSIAADLLRRHPPSPAKAKAPTLSADADNGEALRIIARAGLDHLLANQDCLLRSGDVEAIHQMRVALRRLRAAIALFKPMLSDPVSQDIRADLRWMQQSLGAARDGDVLLGEILQPLDRQFALLPGYGALHKAIEAMRQRDRAQLLGLLSAPRFSRSVLRLACWLETAGKDHPLAAMKVRNLALATLDQRYRRVRKQMAQFHSLDEAGRHDCRIQIKKLRYALDFFGSLIPDRRVGKLVGQLAQLQDIFGRLNDIATARQILQRLALDSTDSALAWAAGLVAGWHQNRVDALLSQVLDCWHEIEKSPRFWKGEVKELR